MFSLYSILRQLELVKDEVHLSSYLSRPTSKTAQCYFKRIKRLPFKKIVTDRIYRNFSLHIWIVSVALRPFFDPLLTTKPATLKHVPDIPLRKKVRNESVSESTELQSRNQYYRLGLHSVPWHWKQVLKVEQQTEDR